MVCISNQLKSHIIVILRFFIWKLKTNWCDRYIEVKIRINYDIELEKQIRIIYLSILKYLYNKWMDNKKVVHRIAHVL